MTPSKPTRPAQATRDSVRDIQRNYSVEFARMLGQVRRDSGAPVRQSICLKPDPLGRSPLSRLLSTGANGGGGRGGDVRLKLYISLLWVAAKSPYTVTRPARAWAALLGLEDHEVKGARRIQKAISDLAELGFVSVLDRPGRASQVTVLDETGSRAAYSSPADAYSALAAANAPRSELEVQKYVKLPSRFWTDGLIVDLSAAGVAMLLILLTAAAGKKTAWVAPSVFAEKYGLSGATQTKGLDELRKARLISSKSKPVSEQGVYFIGEKRFRKVHTIRLEKEVKLIVTS